MILVESVCIGAIAAVARALANRPLLLFADEPTGALDLSGQAHGLRSVGF